MRTNRKWGYYDVLASGKTNGVAWKIKKLVIFPGEYTSMQRHFFRSEFWIDDTGGTHIIEVKRWHQISNSTSKKRVLIELQWGKACRENDIERATWESNWPKDEIKAI